MINEKCNVKKLYYYAKEINFERNRRSCEIHEDKYLCFLERFTELLLFDDAFVCISFCATLTHKLSNDTCFCIFLGISQRILHLQLTKVSAFAL